MFFFFTAAEPALRAHDTQHDSASSASLFSKRRGAARWQRGEMFGLAAKAEARWQGLYNLQACKA